FLLMILIGSVSYAEQGGGEQTDFVSSTLSDVFNTFGGYISGDREVLKDHEDADTYVEYDDTGLTKGVPRTPSRPRKNMPDNDIVNHDDIKISGSTGGK
ncbi:MAG: hypothetical protein WCT15_07160, partial [Candidatus Omnitrophota bacterium]